MAEFWLAALTVEPLKKKGTDAFFTSLMTAEKQQTFIITDNQQTAALCM